MILRAARSVGLLFGLSLALGGCAGGDPIDTAHLTPPGGGPRVVWDLGARPFPEIPLPNDVATWPDPTSPTGVRVNASMVAPTALERALRRQFDEMDGWGTFMPISLAFSEDLDLDVIVRRHQRDEYDFTDDVIYLVDLETGIPVPLDVGNGHFPLTLANPRGWYPNDPRAGESNLLLSTIDEDTNGDGILQPAEDTNHDGVMQRAALHPRGARPEDALTTYWEPETRSLIVRPLVPLRERTRYAVVVTDRLRGTDGRPVRSPFDTIAHPTQLGWLAAMQRHLADPRLSQRFYGDLSWNGGRGSRVAFAWTFVTQTTVRDMVDVYRGLHGEGRLRALASVAPDFRVEPAHGGVSCTPQQMADLHLVRGTEIKAVLQSFLPQLGLGGQLGEALIASYDWIDYVAIARVTTPYLSGAPDSPDPDARWHLDEVARGNTGGRDTVQVWIFVPRARPDATPPFPVAFNAHGYGAGAVQAIAFAGYFARFGIATVAANAPEHGFPLPAAAASTLRTYLRGLCLGPFGNAMVAGRSRDVNGDGNADSGANFLTAHIFHTRDMIRQTALDYMQVARAMTEPAWSQPGAVDYNGDGRRDAPGDLDGDGTVDVGGTRDGRPVPFYIWGESLGGITSMVLGGLDPAFVAVAPISGGAGLTDVSVRSTVAGVPGAVLTPTMGPMIVAVPQAERGPVQGRRRSACQEGDYSLRWVVPDANGIGELEFDCTPLGGDRGTLAPGDDVVVHNRTTGAERCARVPMDGRLFLPVAADRGDPVVVTVYRGAVITDFHDCTRPEGVDTRAVFTSFRIGEGDCDIGCGHVPANAGEDSPARRNGYARGARLVAPASGLGLKRQTSTLRRFLQLAQAGIDPGDPANFAPLFFLRPWDGRPHPILTMTTVGDTDVPVASGNTFARAAGLLPFIRRPTGTELDDYVAPPALLERYDATPDTVLLVNHVFEGLARLERHPAGTHRRYLFDADDLDEGRQGFGEQTLSRPLRLVRAARAVHPASGPLVVEPSDALGAIAATWQPATTGTPMASFVNAYVRPEGTHTFYPSDPAEAWDNGAYLTNLVARFFQSNGTDVVFYTLPAGHQCLEDSSCAFIPRAPE
jgi:hypothetical protein